MYLHILRNLPRVCKVFRDSNVPFYFQVNSEWAQVEAIELENDGGGLAFGIIGGRSTGVVVKTILPGGVADRVSTCTNQLSCRFYAFKHYITSIILSCVP